MDKIDLFKSVNYDKKTEQQGYLTSQSFLSNKSIFQDSREATAGKNKSVYGVKKATLEWETYA